MTGDWGDWDVVRRHVALCVRMGQELVETAEVRVEGKVSLSTATVRHDGIYFCLDLPSGVYRVTGAHGRGDVFGGGTAHVSRDADGNITYAVVDLTSSSSPPAQPRPARRRRSQ